MFFFGKNLKREHKLGLCLLVLGILANVFLMLTATPEISFVEIQPEDHTVNFNVTQIILVFVTFIKLLVLVIFRKL